MNVCTDGFKIVIISICLFLLGFSSNKFNGEGKAIITPAVITPQYIGEVTIKFTVGKHGTGVGGGIKTAFPRRWGSQNKEPEESAYITVTLSRKESGHKIKIQNNDPSLNGVRENHTSVITVTITQKPLVDGDTITISYLKKKPKKTPAYTKEILVASDTNGDDTFALIKEFPSVTIRSGPPEKIYAIAPTIQQTGKGFDLKIAVLDSSFNPVTDYSGTINFTSSDKSAKLPIPYTFSPNDGGVKRIPVVLNTPGYHTITVSNKSGNLKGVTNPVDCKDTKPDKKIWWGDLHSHSEISRDAIGSNPFKYAKDVAGLDFYSLTEHSDNVRPRDWKSIKRKTIRFHQPGKFVTILAYEASMHTPSGHYNVFINCPNNLIPKIPIARRVNLKDENNRLSVIKLWGFLKQRLPPEVEVITVPHHTGVMWIPQKGPVVSFDPPYQNPKKTVAIEIFSKHGTSEKYDLSSPLAYHNWFHPLYEQRKSKSLKIHFPANGPHYAQDAWAKKLYLGVIASTDDHEAHPGMPGRATVYNPLAAVYSEDLTRNSIFTAIKKRETYATSGERIILDFTLNNHPMGSEVSLSKEEKPTLSVKARGTDLIDFVEILKWDFIAGKYDEDGHPIFQSVLYKEVKALDVKLEFVDDNFKNNCLYYVRVKQLQTVTDNEAWAWSSPIWVKDL